MDDMLLVLLVLLSLSALSTAEACHRDVEILKSVLTGSRGEERPVDSDGRVVVELDLHFHRLAFVPHTNTLNAETVLTRKWMDEGLTFPNYEPCHETVNVPHKPSLWQPPLAFVDEARAENATLQYQLSQNGSMRLDQRADLSVPCLTDALTYPFGNTTCTILWRYDSESRDSMQFMWRMDEPDVETGKELPFKTVGDLELLDISFDQKELFRSNGVFDELSVTLHLRRSHQKLALMFYLPAAVFLLISWFSMLLGPMAITRSVLICTSFLLLYLHFTSNLAGLPETTGITGIDLWKVFCLLFTFCVLLELVCVTCMASMGRSRTLGRCFRKNKTRKGKYELEPLYEELNDLRTRRTRRTSGCCRYSALAVDFFVFILLGCVLAAFLLAMHFKGQDMVKCINEFRWEDWRSKLPF